MECTRCQSAKKMCTGTPPLICPQCAIAGFKDGCNYVSKSSNGGVFARPGGGGGGGGIIQPAVPGAGVGVAVAPQDPRAGSSVGENMNSNNNENLEEENEKATNANKLRRKAKADRRAAKLAAVVAMNKASKLTNNEGSGRNRKTRKQKNRKQKFTRKQK